MSLVLGQGILALNPSQTPGPTPSSLNLSPQDLKDTYKHQYNEGPLEITLQP